MIEQLKQSTKQVIEEWPAFLFCVAVLFGIMYFGFRTLN